MRRPVYRAHPSLRPSCFQLPGAEEEQSLAARDMLWRLHPVREKPQGPWHSRTADTRCSKDRPSLQRFSHHHLALYLTTAARANLPRADRVCFPHRRVHRGMPPTADMPVADLHESWVQSPDTTAKVPQLDTRCRVPALEAAADAERQMSG